MPPPANPLDDPADAAAYARYCDGLLAAVLDAVPAWAARVSDGVDAGRAMGAEVETELRALLDADVEAQRTNPLAILRHAARHVTAAMAAVGVPPVTRDADAERLFPDDVYDLGPAAFADLGPEVHDAGLTWGAAKAHLILRRHRS